MTFFRTLITTVALAVAGLPASAEKLSLDAISTYLNTLTTAKASFTQINDDGTISTGTIYLKRPGRARFEYNAPSQALIVVGGSQVAIFDGKSNAGPQQFPLKQTPLNLILTRNVNLSKEKLVVGHTYDGIATTVLAHDAQNPQIGEIALTFAGQPAELRQWRITDNAGGKTTVILGDLTKGLPLKSSLFSITIAAKAHKK